MSLKEIGWEGVESIFMAQDKDQWWLLVNTVLHLQVPLKSRAFLD
jgi:hypothetical protein